MDSQVKGVRGDKWPGGARWRCVRAVVQGEGGGSKHRVPQTWRCRRERGLYMASLQVTADPRRWLGWHGKSGLWCPIVHNACMRGPWGEANTNAISRHATSSVDAEPAA